MNRQDVQAAIDKAGQLIELRRRTGPGDAQQYHAVATRGVVRRAQESGLPGEQVQTTRRITIGYADLERHAWPAPPVQGDRVVIDGKETAILSVEARTIRDAVARYELIVRG